MTETPEMSSPPIWQQAPNPQRRNLGEAQGTFSVLIVRVEAINAATSVSESDLAGSVFGNNIANPQTINMSSQYKACSHDKLHFVEASDRNGKSSATKIRKGATTVYVNVSTSQGDWVMRNAVTEKLNEEFNVSRPSELADHVMYCLPPNTFNGVAYAFINSWNSVYNDRWCTMLSAQMHEIGHNLNLGHSNEIGAYQDQSGMMGFSYFENSSPRMCFNAAKLWQLGWNSNRHKTVSASDPFYIGNLAGFTDNPDVDGPPMIIKLDAPSTQDYFINFNVRASFNSGTREGGDQVLVVQAGDGIGYSESELKAKLGSGSSYKISNFDNGMDLTVEVVSINTQTRLAEVRVCLGNCPPDCTSNFQCNDSDPCTVDTCSDGVCSNTRVESDECSLCPGESVLDVTIITDKYPTETSWTIQNECTNTIQISGGGYTKPETTYPTGKICVPKGNYKFTINDTFGDGICCRYGQGGFVISYNDSPINIDPMLFSFQSSTIINFGEGCQLENYLNNNWETPTPRPTKSPTKQPTKIPTRSPTRSPTRNPTASPIEKPWCGQSDRSQVRFCNSVAQGPLSCSQHGGSNSFQTVGDICPLACGIDCSCYDLESFIHNGRVRDCDWAVQRQKCGKVKFDNFCPKTCGLCNP
eukprot:CAMPEP_0176500276 /NCGR_PEP_ID=MMETSP0200_2-20121128/13434_1 /TAXON_ID=947934 /ORGANISM="Chaetoceros sp., Strain GSL56" /LENGTH=640 /DNA_ID=CAMNT_0017898871 /DNA_START=1953 /DNA_END=3875 /DNA_ORIENTATION=+